MSPARKTPAVPWLRSVPSTPKGDSESPRRSDAELIEAVVRGDGAVAGELYDRLFHTVDQTLYRVLGRRESDHEDLVQSAFEQIVKTLATRRFAGACSLKTWAASVATHVGLNALRSRRRERGAFDRSDDGIASAGTATDNPERDAGLRHELDTIRRELCAMNPARAETLFLHQVL